MHVISTNIGQKRTVIWKNKEYETGIFKYPVDVPIHLETYGVRDDQIANLKVHGGIDKSCYLYSADYYDYWKELYPDLDWTWGMFGENLTVAGLDETEIRIGDVFEVGSAHIQVSQPRQPCSKLGIKFKDQKVLKDFIKAGYSGVYVRVIKEGLVKKGDDLKLLIRSKSGLPVLDIFRMLYDEIDEVTKVENAIYDGNLSVSIKQQLEEKIRKTN